MGQARQRWEDLVEVWEKGEVDRLPEIYTRDAVYYEPHNPPHHGNLLIAAYLKDFLAAREDLKVTVKRSAEDEQARVFAVEWAISYTAAGRRWQNLPRASFLEIGDAGRIVYQRDY